MALNSLPCFPYGGWRPHWEPDLFHVPQIPPVKVPKKETRQTAPFIFTTEGEVLEWRSGWGLFRQTT